MILAALDILRITPNTVINPTHPHIMGRTQGRQHTVIRLSSRLIHIHTARLSHL